MSTLMSQVTVRRLAFAKYLLATGIEKTKQPEPLATAGLLSLHDAVEFANHVAVEHLNANLPKRADFLDYWDVLDQVLSPKVIPHRATMERLNKARVALKHHGTMPSRLDLESFVETARRFFMEMFPLVFGLDFHSVSMVEFIASPKAKSHVKLAQDHLRGGTLSDGFNEAAAAFSELLFDFEKNTKDEMGRPLIGAAAHRSRIDALLHDVHAMGLITRPGGDRCRA